MRVWKREGTEPTHGPCAVTSPRFHYVPHWVGWGHTTRVWDAVFLTCAHMVAIVSAREDGTAHLWNMARSDAMAVLRGHHNAHVSLWGVVTAGHTSLTVGNDGSVMICGY